MVPTATAGATSPRSCAAARGSRACADAPRPVPSGPMPGTATIAALHSVSVVCARNIIAIAT
jgi:hypothetical protein